EIWPNFSTIKANIPHNFFAQFGYPRCMGQDCLFQDPACTILVSNAGVDTIGGVRSPFTGDILFTQPNASKRPLWMGRADGAKFDGVDDYLQMATPWFTNEASIFFSHT